MSGRTSSGSLGRAAAPLGMPSGKVAHHPGWKPLQGSASDHVPGWAPSPCRLPGPVPRYETCLRRVFTAATVSSTPSRAPEKVVRVNPFLARLHYVACMTVCIYCMYRYRRRPRAPLGEAAAQLSSNSLWPALRDCATRESVPGQTYRTPRGGLEDEIVHVRLDVDSPEARQHHAIGTANTSVAAAKSCCTGHHRRAAPPTRR